MQRNLLVAVVAIALCPSLFATRATAQQPTGLEVVQRSAQAAGGQESFSKIKSIVMKGTFKIPNAGAQGTVVTQYAAPDRALVTVDLGQFGKTIQQIRDGKGTESSAVSGKRQLGDMETQRLLESISMRNAFEPEKIYAEIINHGTKQINGQECYHIQLKRKGAAGADEVYYSTKTWLPIKTVTSRPTPAGATVIESHVSDYKEYAGIKLATKITQHIPAFGVTHEIQIESVEINAKLDDQIFTAPVK